MEMAEKLPLKFPGGVCQEIDTYSEEPRGQIKRVYPFENSYIKLGLQFFIYSILFCAVAAGMLALNHLLKTKGLCVSGFFIRTVRIYDIFWIWILLYSIAIFHYKIIGIPNYLQIGDENFYWNTLLLQNGKLEITYLASLFSPRGYWCYLFQTIARYTGTFLHMDPVLIWLLFPSSFISWFAVIILPGFLNYRNGIFSSYFSYQLVLASYKCDIRFIWCGYSFCKHFIYAALLSGKKGEICRFCRDKWSGFM